MPSSGARHADAADDRRVLRIAAVQQRVDHVGERDRAGPDPEAEQRRERQDRERQREPGAPGDCRAPGARAALSLAAETLA